MFSEQRIDHPRVQTLTSLNVFGITWIMRCRKCNQLLRLNFEGVEKCPCRFRWTESKTPEKNGICNKGKVWTKKIDIILCC